MLPIRLATERGALAQAATILNADGIVAFPTETVYGLCVAYGSRSAIQRLARTKCRRAGQPFQLLLSSARRMRDLCGDLPDEAGRLAKAFWPGPLTLVVRGKSGRWIGLRVPDHPVARDLAKRAGGVLVATSANLSGERPACDAREVAAAFDKGIELVLDGGPAVIGTASSVVRVTNRYWEILREGAISEAELARVIGDHPLRKGC